MTQWYRRNHRLFHREREALARSCPLMMLSVVGPRFPINQVLVTSNECALAHGVYSLRAPSIEHEVEYGITLWIPEKYPGSPPIMFCNDPRLPVGILDRHIINNGQACLEIPSEVKRRWRSGSILTDFLSNLVGPFLAWQAYYDAFGKPPEWGERAHGGDGIIHFYAELLGLPIDGNILGFMKLMSRKNRPKGHEPCPCNSNLKLRNCHQKPLYAALAALSWKDIRYDYELISKTGMLYDQKHNQREDKEGWVY